jgi:hypothetical protein
MTPVVRKHLCLCCNRPRPEVDGQVAIRRGGYPLLLCYDCIDELKAAVDEARAEPTEKAY